MTRSKLGLVVFGLVLSGGLLIGGVAVSQKTAPGPAAVAVRQTCNNPAALEKAHKVVSQIIDVGRWTAKDHDQVQLVFAPLHNDQKLEILRKVAAAIDSKKLIVEKGARLF
jgi:hypothetical protein